MPTLSLSVTDAQATRVEAALRQRYAGGAMANATLAQMARDYLLSTLTALVLEHERREAMKQAEGQLVKEF